MIFLSQLVWPPLGYPGAEFESCNGQHMWKELGRLSPCGTRSSIAGTGRSYA
jgi:hypothetical protein